MNEFDDLTADIMAEGEALGPDAKYVTEGEAYLHQQVLQHHHRRRCGGKGDVHLLWILPCPLVMIEDSGRFYRIQAVIVTEHADGRVQIWRCSNLISACDAWDNWD